MLRVLLCHLEWHVECLSLSHMFVSFFLPLSPNTVSAPEADSFVMESSFLVISSSWFGYCYWWDAPSLGLFIQGSGVPLSCCATWSGSMHKVHIAFQDPQAVVLILCKMVFRLSEPYIWTVVLLKLTYLIKAVQLLFSFPDEHVTYWIWLTILVLLLFQLTYLPISMWEPTISYGIS